MNKLFCVLLVILCPFFVNPEKALTRDLVQALTASLAGFEQLTVEFPELEDSLDQSGLYTDKVKALKTIKSSTRTNSGFYAIPSTPIPA